MPIIGGQVPKLGGLVPVLGGLDPIVGGSGAQYRGVRSPVYGGQEDEITPFLVTPSSMV